MHPALMTLDPVELETRRRAARRTAFWLGGLALSIYGLFLLSRWLA
jgi:hypothetical protein